MDVKGSGSKVFRVSVSSALSTSSHGSAPDDYDALGDVHIWGEVICDSSVKVLADKNASYLSMRADVLLTRPLEYNVVLDVHHVACGVKHAALVTRQGEVFIGVKNLEDNLAMVLGQMLFNLVLLNHWLTLVLILLPVVNFILVLLQWLGNFIHGEMELTMLGFLVMVLMSATGYQREFQCQCFIRKIIHMGDGDKNPLGHGDKEPRLKPTCVPALIDYNLHKVACGHRLTIGLTTSGHVFTMSSTVYGQLGNSYTDGNIPSLVKDKLSGECVEEITCGAYHVAVLTSRNEVYTWGKGANGRLGHGDVEDRKKPTLVEGLKDRHVKFIACGSNYSAAICLHKWVSGAEQSQFSACRQAFGFTRKRHNCYNCGLVHCHSCSSKKAPGAALAPTPGKPYRVCDSCFAKLNKVSEAGNNSRKNSGPRLSGENKDRLDKAEIRSSKSATPSNMDLIKQLDSKVAKQVKKAETFSLVRSNQAPSLVQFKDVLSNDVDSRRTLPKPILTGSGVETLRKRCELQELELQKSTKETQEAMTLAAEESAKSRAAEEVIKSLTAQLKDMAERFPSGVYGTENVQPPYLSKGLEPNGVHYQVQRERDI
ncbi:Regulator of chromosome condensation (RCC1) family with FYVE zinc finger domain isoform 3 [Hibiscus syriacus]|uniref:Regulator of chromosome condensation (RCC1) family with FYVE zinc finger domain isoform 3 n=1 Tax=Hibiscus syriacus TaxID=106335 RepID=A0A6A2Z1N9_HIBSY|nr:Regulator of chromosome condensation (RCC1) family with FYVE zinc finger domain isoform 3 [Hibiscus syriacus]